MTERDDALEPYFAAARGAKSLEPDFMARLEADALAATPGERVVTLPQRAQRLWAGGGLLAAGVAGLAIGLGLTDTLNGFVLDDGAAFELAEFLPMADPASFYGAIE